MGLLGDKQGGIGGDNHVSYSVVAAPSHGHDHGIRHGSSYSSHDQAHGHSYYPDHGHGFGNTVKVVKVILNQGHGVGQASHYSYASGHNYGSSGYGQGGEAEIVKVISQHAAASTPAHVNHGYFAGANHGLSSDVSYASSYNHVGYDSFSSQLNAILPQILDLILGQNGGGSASDLHNQLVSHFGHSGKAYITPANGRSNSYYSSGHVVEKGVLEVTRLEGEPHPFSLLSSPVYEQAAHAPGW